MNQPAPIDRNARLEPAQDVIFSGTPSQAINLPVFIKGAFAAVIAFAAHLYAMMHWLVPWFVLVLALLLIGVGVVVAYLRTAFTEIVIDTARITPRQGILSRRVQSIELFRIQDVTSLHPWWRRLFNIGTVIVLTSDSNNPHWRLPGMRDAEQLRDDLNRAAIALRDAKGIREVNMGRV